MKVEKYQRSYSVNTFTRCTGQHLLWQPLVKRPSQNVILNTFSRLIFWVIQILKYHLQDVFAGSRTDHVKPTTVISTRCSLIDEVIYFYNVLCETMNLKFSFSKYIWPRNSFMGLIFFRSSRKMLLFVANSMRRIPYESWSTNSRKR